MSREKVLFVIFAGLAAGWTGVLAYLAFTIADPVVVSAPQLYLSTLVIAAEVKPMGNDEVRARIVKVFKNASRIPDALPGTITVQWSPGYGAPGVTTYLLALRPAPGKPDVPTYEVTPIPRYLQRGNDHEPDQRVYPYTDSVRIQTERILGK